MGKPGISRSRTLAVTTLAAPLQGSAPLQVKTLSPRRRSQPERRGNVERLVDFTCQLHANGCTLKTNGEWYRPTLRRCRSRST